jgi:4-hydroxy-3-polyprenylbenzoate decarboxylase
MKNTKRKIVVAVTGASGAVYTSVLLKKLGALKSQVEEVGVVFSANATGIWNYELKTSFEAKPPVKVYAKNDFYAPFASGSSSFDTMIVCPCSMGTLGRIAHGISDDLITRAADVMLKERRKLVLVPRETPYSLIHIENMRTITLAGGIICPATPSFYSNPETIEQAAETVVDRILQLSGFEIEAYRWRE